MKDKARVSFSSGWTSMLPTERDELVKSSRRRRWHWPDIFVHQTSTSTGKKSLTTWHRRLGHLNFRTPRQYLRTLDIDFTNEPDEIVCDSCLRAKATKIYNRKTQKRAEYLYYFIYTNLVILINFLEFGGELYFFTFTNNFTRYTGTNTRNKKSDWFRCL